MLIDITQTFISALENGSFSKNLFISAIVLSGFIIAHVLTFAVIGKIANRRSNDFLLQVKLKFSMPTLILLLGVVMRFIVHFSFAESIIKDNLIHVIYLIILTGITWIIIRIVKLGRDVILLKYNIEDKDNLKARRVYTQFKILERIVNFIVIITAIAIALMTFEGIQKIGVSLFASAGVAGIIIGFAAQKLIATVLAGFQIAITQPIRLEDVVIVENEWGWIEEITLTYVVIRIWDKRRLIVPTTYFIEHPFQNWTRVSSDILGTVFLYTDYTVPFEALRKELTRILEADSRWDGKVNVLQVTDAKEQTVEIRALVSAADSPTAWDLRVHIREKLIEFIQREYPQALPKTRVNFDKAHSLVQQSF